MKDPMLTCESVWELLSVYADQEAAPDEAAMVERHVAACAECARDLAFMRETSRLVTGEDEVAPPAALRESILAATVRKPTWRERALGAARMLARPSAGYGMGLAAACAAILAVVVSSRLSMMPAAPVPARIASTMPTVARLAPSPSPPPSLRPQDLMDMLAPFGSAPDVTVSPVSPAARPSRMQPAPMRRSSIQLASVPRRIERARVDRPRVQLAMLTHRSTAAIARSSHPLSAHRPAATHEWRAPRRVEIAARPARLSPEAASERANEKIRVEVAEINHAASEEHAMSLADLRRAIRRDNESQTGSIHLEPASFRSTDHPEIVASVVKARF